MTETYVRDQIPLSLRQFLYIHVMTQPKILVISHCHLKLWYKRDLDVDISGVSRTPFLSIVWVL